MTDLLAPGSDLRGAAPATVDKLAKLTGGGRGRDLLFHLPDSFIDRRTRATLQDTLPGQIVTWAAERSTFRRRPADERRSRQIEFVESFRCCPVDCSL